MRLNTLILAAASTVAFCTCEKKSPPPNRPESSSTSKLDENGLSVEALYQQISRNTHSSPKSSEVSGEQDVLTKIAIWRSISLSPIPAHEDKRSEFERRSAMSDLARAGRIEAVEALMESFFVAENRKFWDDHSSKYANDLLFMPLNYLSCWVEDTPPPLVGVVYTTKDLPNWREWWLANKGKIKLKEKGVKPAWIKERMNVHEGKP